MQFQEYVSIANVMALGGVVAATVGGIYKLGRLAERIESTLRVTDTRLASLERRQEQHEIEDRSNFARLEEKLEDLMRGIERLAGIEEGRAIFRHRPRAGEVD